jgi:phospholipase C
MTHNPNSVQPFRMDRSQAIVCDQSHDYTGEQKALDGGLMDKFVDLDGTTQTGCNDLGLGKGLVMGYYDGNTVTALWDYAQHFAMNDNFFSTNFGPSTLGHLNLASGQTNGATIAHDAGTAAAALLNVTVINDIRPAFDDRVPSTANTVSMSGLKVGDLLNQKGISWGWFQSGFAPSSRNADQWASETVDCWSWVCALARHEDRLSAWIGGVGISGEVVIERNVFLEDHDDVLYRRRGTGGGLCASRLVLSNAEA